MKYKVFIRGQKEPIITKDSSILLKFNNYLSSKVNDMIKIGNWHGKISDIKSIQEFDENESDWREKYEQYNRERRERAKRSPEEKAESSVNGQYKLYAWCVGVDFETTKDKAKELALKFFKENPERNLADLNIWFRATGLESKDIKLNSLQEAGLAILARAINSEIAEIEKDLQAFGGGFSYPQ